MVHSTCESSQDPNMAAFTGKLCCFNTSSINMDENTRNPWIIDIVALDHMIHVPHLYTQITSNIESDVVLPNRERVKVSHIRTVKS